MSGSRGWNRNEVKIDKEHLPKCDASIKRDRAKGSIKRAAVTKH